MTMRKLLEAITKFAGEPAQKPGDQVRGTEKAKKSKDHPFKDRLVGGGCEESAEPQGSILKDLNKGPTPKTKEQELAEAYKAFLEAELNEDPFMDIGDKRPGRDGARPSRGHELQPRYKNVNEDFELNVGDPVEITGDVEFKGATGEIDSFGRNGAFIVVNLYNHGRHSFNASDVSYNDYADSDEEEAEMYDRDPAARAWTHDQEGEDLNESASESDDASLVLAEVMKLIGEGHTEVSPDVITTKVSAALGRPFMLKDLIACNNSSPELQQHIDSINPSKIKFSTDILTVKNEDPAKEQAKTDATISNMASRAASRPRLGEATDTYNAKTGAWSHEGDWVKKDKKDPVGKVHHMSDVARRKTEKQPKPAAECKDELNEGTSIGDLIKFKQPYEHKGQEYLYGHVTGFSLDPEKLGVGMGYGHTAATPFAGAKAKGLVVQLKRTPYHDAHDQYDKVTVPTDSFVKLGSALGGGAVQNEIWKFNELYGFPKSGADIDYNKMLGQEVTEAAADRVYTVDITRSRGMNPSTTRSTSGTLAELIKYFGYTLEVGKSYEGERGRYKINMMPKNIQSLVDNLNKAASNSAANGAASTYYDVGGEAVAEGWESGPEERAPRERDPDAEYDAARQEKIDAEYHKTKKPVINVNPGEYWDPVTKTIRNRATKKVIRNQFDETVLNTANPKDDLSAKRRALADLERTPGVDPKAVQQRKIDLDHEARSKGVSEDKAVPVISAFRRGMEKIANSDMNPQAKQAAFDKLSAEFHKNAEAYSQSVKAKQQVKEYGAVGPTGTTDASTPAGTGVGNPPVNDPKQMQNVAQATNALKQATGSTVAAPNITKALNTGAQGKQLAGQDIKALEPTIDAITAATQDPNIMNQLAPALKKATAQAKQQQKQQQTPQQ